MHHFNDFRMEHFWSKILSYLSKSVNMLLWKLIIMILIFSNLWAMFGDEVLPPDGHIFHWLMLFIVSHIGSKISYLLRLPSLFGMLISG